MDDRNPLVPAVPAPLPAQPAAIGPSLSYKFQRLREKIRAAIAAGELSGRLPGERILSRRFHANPKTLSKALSDLAAEGVLQRRVGQGTFVASAAPTPVGHWLILCDEGASQPLLSELLRLLPESRCAEAAEPLRPSALVQVSGVISLAARLGDAVVRDLQLRGVPVVECGQVGGLYSTHAVAFDRHRAAFEIGRRLLLAGHQHIAAVDAKGSSQLCEAIELAEQQLKTGAVVQPCTPQSVVDVAAEGATAWVCHNTDSARAVHHDLSQSVALLLRDDFSITAIDEIAPADAAYSGWYLDPVVHAREIVSVLPSLQPHRRSILCLRGEFVERNTLRRRPQHARPIPRWQLAGVA